MFCGGSRWNEAHKYLQNFNVNIQLKFIDNIQLYNLHLFDLQSHDANSMGNKFTWLLWISFGNRSNRQEYYTWYNFNWIELVNRNTKWNVKRVVCLIIFDHLNWEKRTQIEFKFNHFPYHNRQTFQHFMSWAKFTFLLAHTSLATRVTTQYDKWFSVTVCRCACYTLFFFRFALTFYYYHKNNCTSYWNSHAS